MRVSITSGISFSRLARVLRFGEPSKASSKQLSKRRREEDYFLDKDKKYFNQKLHIWQKIVYPFDKNNSFGTWYSFYIFAIKYFEF